MENTMIKNNYDNIQETFMQYGDSLKSYFGKLSPKLKEIASIQMFKTPYRNIKNYLNNYKKEQR